MKTTYFEKQVKLRAEIVAAESDAMIKAEAAFVLVGFYIHVNLLNKIKH